MQLLYTGNLMILIGIKVKRTFNNHRKFRVFQIKVSIAFQLN